MGATILARSFTRTKRSVIMGAILGGSVGIIAPQLAMLPLVYCPFNPEHHEFFTFYFLTASFQINAVLGIALVLIGVTFWALILLADFVHLRLMKTGSFWPQRKQLPSHFTGWRWFPWLLLAPSLIVLTLFTYIPAVNTFSLATRLARLGAPRTRFICLNNFSELIAGDGASGAYYLFSQGYIFHVENVDFLYQVAVSVFLSLATVLLANVLGLGIALIAYRNIRGGNFYRTLLVWPFVLSPLITGRIFLGFFGSVGLFNNILANLGLARIDWVLDTRLTPWVVVIAAAWNILGFNLLFYISALQTVPPDLIEHAQIDGANVWQRFWHIKLPMLSPIIFFLVFINLTYTFFDLFGLIDKFTAGGPLDSTTNLIYEIYTIGIVNNDLGKAAARSIVLLLVVAGLTILQFRLSRQRVVEEI